MGALCAGEGIRGSECVILRGAKEAVEQIKGRVAFWRGGSLSVSDSVTPLSVHVRRRTFFGEPRALAYLALTEAWERFSYYGMTAILVLYMSQSLFLPGHVEHVVGFAVLRSGLESILGPLSTLALSSLIFGLYTGAVYVTPVFGGWVADRWLGRRNAVVLGALLMSAGHQAMAFDASFLLALSLLIVGCGFLKGNISTQIGTLYSPSDGAGQTRGFAIFSVGINVGAVIGPLACGLLAQLYGWHAGFGLAGILMLIGLATYLSGYRELMDSSRTAAVANSQETPLGYDQWNSVLALLAVMMITVFQSIAYYQCGDIALVWINRDVDLNLLGFRVPVAWFNSIDSLVSIIAVPAVFAFWRRQAARHKDSGEIGKIGIGAWIACLANLILVAGCAATDRVPVLVPLAYFVLLGIAFLFYWPTLLALVARAAPPRIRATMMGIAFLTMFLANVVIGWLGSLFERMIAAQFWAMHAAIAAIGGILALVLQRRLSRIIGMEVARAS
jgi:proton-dependent oligopeptide transporter, POT family